MVLYRC